MIDRRDAPAPPDNAAPPARLAVPEALDALATLADRLRRLASDIGDRAGAPEWDAADRVSARLLLQELRAALVACRAVTDTSAEQLQQLDATLTDIAAQL